MLFIKKDIIEAVKYYRDNQSLSKMSVCRKYNIDKATLRKYADINIDNLLYVDEKDVYVKFTEKEKEAIDAYKTGKVASRFEICKQYGFHTEKMSQMLKWSGVSYKNATYKYSFDERKLTQIVSEEDAYILGFILTDGYICNARNTVRIKLNKRDEDILCKIREYLGYDKEIATRIHQITKNELSEYSIHNRAFVDTLIGYAGKAKKADRTTFFHDVPENLMRHYLRGVFDADGAIRLNPAQIKMCGSETSMEFILDYLKSKLNMTTPRKVYHDKSCNISQLIFCGPNAAKVALYLYGDAKISIDRKQKLAEELINKYGHV